MFSNGDQENHYEREVRFFLVFHFNKSFLRKLGGY